MSKYKKPFVVRDGRIVDVDGKEVRLWGVNYYLPFNHNYVNIEEMGIDHLKAIDRDIADFKRMNIDLVRMHVFDREISDIYGNIVENDQLRVMDYLIEQLDKAGIYVMMTAMTWYNTVATQQSVTKEYAYWSIGKCQTFGFSNFYTAHEMIWNEKALACQENYLNQFFARKNVFSGKTLNDYDNLAVIEVMNEPIYPNPGIIDTLRKERAVTANPYKLEEAKLVELYDAYKDKHKLEDTEDIKQRFCTSLVDKYLRRVFAVVDKYFGDTVIKTNIFYGFENEGIYKCLNDAPINSISVTAYAPNYFDTTYNDHRNALAEIRALHAYYQPLSNMKKGLVCYEFDSPTTLTGKALGAFGYMLAALGVQIAAYFTYTPVDVAAYNPGWIVHYLNLRHTPTKGAALTAAGEIFRRTQFGAPIPDNDTLWENEYFKVDVERDLVKYADDKTVIYSADCRDEIAGVPQRIIGSGSSRFAEHEGNGCYFIERMAEDTLSLTVLPNQWYVNDPYRGKSFRFMANRYVDTNREWIVSRLKEKGTPMKLLYPGFEQFSVVYEKEGRVSEVAVKNGKFLANPGNYLITKITG